MSKHIPTIVKAVVDAISSQNIREEMSEDFTAGIDYIPSEPRDDHVCMSRAPLNSCANNWCEGIRYCPTRRRASPYP